MLPGLKGGNLGDFQPGAASSVRQDGVFCNTPGLNMFWSSGPETSAYLDLGFFFPGWKSNTAISLTSPVTRTHLTAWNKHKAHVCCIHLLLQPWAVPSGMLTRNKVHSFLSGHRMFPPQAREHFFGYLLGEAWHFHRDCNTETRGGWRRRSLQSPAPGRKRNSRARSMGICHTQPHSSSNQREPELALPTHPKLDSSASSPWIVPMQSWDAAAERGKIFPPWLSQRAAKTEASRENPP